jgi:hypothetical protein
VFTNGDTAFTRHFPADEIGIFEMNIFFLMMQSCVMLLAFTISGELMAINKYHHTIKILNFSVVMQWLAIVFDIIYCARFAQDGMRAKWQPLRTLADICGAASMLAVTLLLILLAKGWTIVRRKISANGRMKIVGYMTFYTFAFFAAQMWHYFTAHKQAKLSYIYGSPPGMAFIALRCFAFLWFLYASYTTASNYAEKRHFYSKFRAGWGLWLVLVPIVALAGTVIDDYVRTRVMHSLELLLTFIAHAILLGMYHPNLACNKKFPFHTHTPKMLGLLRKHGPRGRRPRTPAKGERPGSQDDLDATTGSSTSFDPHAQSTSVPVLRRAKDTKYDMDEEVKMVKHEMEDIAFLLDEENGNTDDELDFDMEGNRIGFGAAPRERDWNPTSFGSDTVGVVSQHARDHGVSKHGAEVVNGLGGQKRAESARVGVPICAPPRGMTPY